MSHNEQPDVWLLVRYAVSGQQLGHFQQKQQDGVEYYHFGGQYNYDRNGFQLSCSGAVVEHKNIK